MSKVLSVGQLQSLFISKVSEKYQLNERDLKRAFSRFDKDGSGLLDARELCSAFKLYLNGVDESQIGELVSCFDTDKDNKISFEEFVSFIMHHSAVPVRSQSRRHSSKGELAPSEMLTLEQSNQRARHSSRQDADSYQSSERSSVQKPLVEMAEDAFRHRRRNSETDQSEVLSELNSNNPSELENRATVYLQCLKAVLVEMKSLDRVRDYLTLSLPEIQREIVNEVITKAFQPYTGIGTGRVRDQQSGVDHQDFCRYCC